MNTIPPISFKECASTAIGIAAPILINVSAATQIDPIASLAVSLATFLILGALLMANHKPPKDSLAIPPPTLFAAATSLLSFGALGFYQLGSYNPYIAVGVLAIGLIGSLMVQRSVEKSRQHMAEAATDEKAEESIVNDEANNTLSMLRFLAPLPKPTQDDRQSEEQRLRNLYAQYAQLAALPNEKK